MLPIFCAHKLCGSVTQVIVFFAEMRPFTKHEAGATKANFFSFLALAVTRMQNEVSGAVRIEYLEKK